VVALAIFAARLVFRFFHRVVGAVLAAPGFLLALLVGPLLAARLPMLLRLRLRAVLLAALLILLVLLVGTLLLLVFTLVLLGHFSLLA
jgi:hypothetical protein